MNEESDLKKLFREWQIDKYNFMTPKIDLLLEKGDIIVEISSGTPFIGLAIRGVTIYRHVDEGIFESLDLDLDKGFCDKDWKKVEADALNYAKEIMLQLPRMRGG